MPLSEEELRLLEQMERALAEEDPKFVSALQGRTLERSARLRAALAAVAFAGGIGMLLGGAVAQLVWLSVLGFMVMLGAGTIGLSAWRGRHVLGAPATPAAAHPAQGSRSFEVIQGGRSRRRLGRIAHAPSRRTTRTPGTFMQRIEQRWEQRRNQR